MPLHRKMLCGVVPSVTEICKGIEDFILELQQKATLPQQFSVEELTEQGAV